MINSSDHESLLSLETADWPPLRSTLLEYGCSSDQMHSIMTLVVASRYALLQISRAPMLALDLLAGKPLVKPIELPLIEGQVIDTEQLKTDLRQYRHRRLLEIIYLDVVKQQPVWQTLKQLTQLAEELIQVSVAACYHNLCLTHGTPRDENGEPMLLNVLAMGKLGGEELNFSSDIDLICCYASDGELTGFGNLSHQEFFSRQVRMLIDLLSDHTENGFVYRTDLRLRPWGDSGPVVLSHSALEHYYQLHGRQWERYALVKARLLTGSQTDQTAVADIIQPFVYRRYHDYQIFDELAMMKHLIESQANEKSQSRNIKIGPGGIREIEFFVQAFQILRGGRHHGLQATRIKTNLEMLSAEKIVSEKIIGELTSAYEFLRVLENRLQMFDDQQVHELPVDENQQQRIAVCMGFSDWKSLMNKLDQVRKAVRRHFLDLFDRQSVTATPIDLNEDVGSPDFQKELQQQIGTYGINETEEIAWGLGRFLKSRTWQALPEATKQRLKVLYGSLLPEIAAQKNQALVFDRLLKLFTSIAGRSVYLELLAQNKTLLQRLVQLFHDSAWIAEEVTRYPMVLESLIQPRTPEQYDAAQLKRQLDQQLNNVKGDRELELDTLRLFKREQTLTIACDELSGLINSTVASTYLSELAEVIVTTVCQLAEAELVSTAADANNQPGMGIVAYGRFGGRELHYQSDLDLVFLYDGAKINSGTDEHGFRSSEYFIQLAQKIIAISNVVTTSGKLYNIDSRLRPEGSSGLLVSSIDAFESYQQNKAWSWEHQALVRARLISGSDQLRNRFELLRTRILSQPRDRRQLINDITDMRERMRRQFRPATDDFFNLKHSRGGLIDIEFMVQFWVLSQANSIGSLCSYSDNISLLNELFRLGLITDHQFKLAAIYQHYQELLHNQVLQNLAIDVELRRVTEEAAHVVQCWQACFTDVEK